VIVEAVKYGAARGFAVGDILRISCEAEDAVVVSTIPTEIIVAWPWGEVDSSSENPWRGTTGVII
jgi:hypothetical protein